MLINPKANPAQARFFEQLASVPSLAPLWDIERLEYREDIVKNFLTSASHGETIMARFFLSVWRGDNHYQFDLVDAADQLNSSQKLTIALWFADPFWP